MDPETIKELIKETISTTYIQVEGDGSHFHAVIVSKDFEGKTPIERHKMVYSALGNSMKSDIHALSIKAYTPSQWENIKR